MSQLDELLNGMSNEELAAYTANPETESHIVIGLDRYITVPESLKRIAVQGDHNIETVTFDCPRYWDGRDLSELKIFINFRCANGMLGTYLIDDVTIDTSDESMIHFNWVIREEATRAKGVLMFLVCAKITDEEGNMVIHWNSEINSEMYVSEGIEAHDDILEKNPDILTRVLLLTDITLTRAGVYVGSGDMPEWANVQVDPTGTPNPSGSIDGDVDVYQITPRIGSDGYWYIGDTNTGVKAQGEDGEPGATGPQGPKGEDGEPGKDGATGETGAQGPAGKDGTSVTVKSVSESTVDGGNNVVTFSDGKSITIKNGSKGSKGDKGDTGATGPQGETGPAGKDGAQGPAGKDGNDYVLTEADKQEIARMAAVAPSIPSYWDTAVDNAIAKAKAMQDMGGNDVVQFVHFSDMHYKSGGTNYTDNIGGVSRKLMDELHIPFLVGTGDITESSAASSSTQIDADVKDALSTLETVGLENLLYCKGNHDGAWGASATYGVNYAMIQHPNKLWNRLYRWQAKDFRRVFSEDGSYYYVDNLPQKVRYIVLNSHWADYSDVTDADHNAQATAKNTQKNVNYGDAQAEWLAKTALDFGADDGWTVVVFTHAPLWNKYNGVQKGYMLAQYAGVTCNASTVRDILVGFYNKSASVTYKSGGTVSYANVGESCTVAGVFCGHCHTDFMVKHDEYGSGTDIPFPIVSITSAGNANSSYEQGFNMPVTTRTKDSATETAFDIVSINKKTKTISTVRMGAGSDRSATYGAEEIIVTLLSISASYSGGSVPAGTSVSALTGVTVTAHYSDGSTAPITGYTLSGTIGEGSNTITVTYEGKTITFTVEGEAEEEDDSVVTGVNVFDSTADGFMDDYRISSSAASTGYVTAASSKNQFVTNYIRVDNGMYVTIDVPRTTTQISTTIGGYYLVYDANKSLIGTYKNTGDGTLANNKYKVQINVSGVAYARFAPYKTSGSGITVANCNIVVTTA